jgi:hypothetical protein
MMLAIGRRKVDRIEGIGALGKVIGLLWPAQDRSASHSKALGLSKAAIKVDEIEADEHCNNYSV